MACSYFWNGNSDGESVSTKNKIEVDKGSPATGRYAIFYAIEEDPVIFCKTKAQVKKELERLKRNPDVKQKSIRVFKLM